MGGPYVTHPDAYSFQEIEIASDELTYNQNECRVFKSRWEKSPNEVPIPGAWR